MYQNIQFLVIIIYFIYKWIITKSIYETTGSQDDNQQKDRKVKQEDISGIEEFPSQDDDMDMDGIDDSMVSSQRF